MSVVERVSVVGRVSVNKIAVMIGLQSKCRAGMLS